MADPFLVLLNESLKRHLLALGPAEKRRLQEKLEFLANGIWDAGVRVKKLKGAGRKTVFEARLSRGDRLLFTLGRHRERVAAYIWGIAAHDDVTRQARAIVPENAPFLGFEPESMQELPETVLDTPADEWLTQENIEEKAGEGYGPQKWLVLNEQEWRRLLAGAEPDALELHLFLTEAQSSLLQEGPPVLLSGTAGSGKTTILVYYLLRPEFQRTRRLFLTYSPFLQRFSERIYRGLVKNTELELPGPAAGGPAGEPSPAVPEFRVFRDLVEDILHSHGAAFDRDAEVRLPEFERIFRNHSLYRRYDPELVWEEIRSIIKGAKPPIDAQGCRRLSTDYLRGSLGQSGLRRLQEYLLGLKPFEWMVKIHRILERKTDFPTYDRFVQSLADPEPAARGKAAFILHEIRRLVEEKARGFASPLLTLAEYNLLGRKRAPNFLYNRQDIYSIAEYYQECLQAEGRWDEIDLCRRALTVLGGEEPRFAYDLVVCDEVQDFADIQLSLVLRLARPFDRIALAGDLKQVINPSGFRWEDVKQKFYERGQEPPEVRLLNLNFRCVGSIVRLANALLELKQALVGLTGTEIREDWKFQGKPPFLVFGIEEEEVLRRVRSAGVGRVVLVREGHEQRRLKGLLASELVFTIHEAKGLEFDAVLLWKIGQDSKAEEVWRRILKGGTPASEHTPHIRHELNLLYVAVTRARNTLILYDGPKPSGLWEVSPLRELIHCTEQKEVLASLWEKASTPQQWREQGDYFFEREHFAAAAECYRNAGEQARMEIAEAFACRARGELERGAELFARHGYHREAAAGFEQTGRFSEAGEHWRRAGEQERARVCELQALESERRYEEAAAGWAELGKLQEAARNWEKARNHARLADYLFTQKDYARAAERYREAGNLARAAESYHRARLWDKAAELYLRAGAWEEAARLFKKLKNQARLLECYEKLGDHFAAAALYEKRRETEKAVAAFRLFAEANPDNRALLLQQAQSYRRGAFKAALRYSALRQFEKSAPLFQASRLVTMARADYLAAGDPLAAAGCLAAGGKHLEAAREMEGLEFPDKEQRVLRELDAHLQESRGSDRSRVHELLEEAEGCLRRGEPRRALRRFQALHYSEGMLRALLSLKNDGEALDHLLENGQFEDIQRYVERRGEELEVPLPWLERLISQSEAGAYGYLQKGEMELVLRLFSRSLTGRREQTLPLLRRFLALRQAFVSYIEELPDAFILLLLEAKNYNAIYDILSWYQFRKADLPERPTLFLDRLDSAGKESEETAFRACAAFLRDREKFDALVADLPVDEWNYKLVGGSGRHRHRAVAWLLERPQVTSGQLEAAAAICRAHRDYTQAAALYERHGRWEAAGRHYREAGRFELALECFRKLGDEPNQARMYEKLLEWDKAFAIWKRLGRTRDLQRVLKRKPSAGMRRAAKPEPKAEGQQELF